MLAWVLLSLCTATTPTELFSHDLWDQVLAQHVSDDGFVDYAAVREDERFAAYLEGLRTAEPDKMPGDAHRLAFWINAYNALTIRGVLAHLPEDPKDWPAFKATDVQVDDKTLWQGMAFEVAGRQLTLDQIQHDIIRATPGLRDPRIHVALTCAARGGPPLMNEAFVADRLNRQLYARMRKQVNDSNRSQFDLGSRSVRLCRVFDWYKEDFANPQFNPHASSVPDFISRYVDDEGLARSLRSDRWTVQYEDFDWRLNLRRRS